MGYHRTLRWAWFLGMGLLGSNWTLAEQKPNDAYQLVEDATARVMAVVESASSDSEAQLEKYYGDLQAVLDDVVDFSGFARAVMGPFASREYYRSLDAAGKARLRAQVDSFTAKMRVGLVRTYGKGLLVFGGSRTEIRRPEGAGAEGNRATVLQYIYSDNPQPYEIRYQAHRNRKGQWKLRNLIVESINLGQIYRNQFQAAARDAGGDLDQVIDNWDIVDASPSTPPSG